MKSLTWRTEICEEFFQSQRGKLEKTEKKCFDGKAQIWGKLLWRFYFTSKHSRFIARARSKRWKTFIEMAKRDKFPLAGWFNHFWEQKCSESKPKAILCELFHNFSFMSFAEQTFCMYAWIERQFEFLSLLAFIYTDGEVLRKRLRAERIKLSFYLRTRRGNLYGRATVVVSWMFHEFFKQQHLVYVICKDFPEA